MEFKLFLDTPIYTWIILPLLIMSARIVDVTIGTLRIIFIAKRKVILAPLLGFFEVLIWLLAIQQIFNNLNNFVCYLAYASGFGLGNYIGMVVEKRLALGLEMIRIITRTDANKLIENLKYFGNGITIVNGYGSNGPVKIIFTVIPRKIINEVLKMINKFDPSAYYTVENIDSARDGVIPLPDIRKNRIYRQMLKMDRKRK